LLPDTCGTAIGRVSTSGREHFYEAGDESAHLAWNSSETCSVYNMLKLTRSVFSWNPSAATMDYYERALYNQILGSQDPDSGGVTYFYCLKPGHFKIYSKSSYN